MNPVSSVNSGAAQPLPPASRTPDTSGAPRSAEAPQPRPARPARDEYIPERRDGQGEERCVCDTAKVDREIRQLRQRQQDLEQRLRAETDPARTRELERQLAQAERELAQKDNDTYRRQNASFTDLS